MTHDWFSHLDEGHNGAAMIAIGCGAEDGKTGTMFVNTGGNQSAGLPAGG